MGKIEVIDAIEEWKLGFSLGNAIKYIARAEHKGDAIADREIERLVKEEVTPKSKPPEPDEESEPDEWTELSAHLTADDRDED